MHPLIAFRSRGFLLLWTSSVLGQVSRWAEFTVLGWLVLDMTGSPFQVALVGFFRAAPGAPFGPFTGILSDRLNRKGVLAAAALVSLGSMLALAILVNAGLRTSLPVFVAVSLTGAAWALDFPSRRAFIRDLLEPDRLVNGMSMESISLTLGRIAGPLAGGAIIAAFGVGAAVAAIAAVYLAQAAFIIPLPRPVRQVPARSARVLQSLLEGLRYAARSQVIVAVLLVTVVLNILAFPLIQILPVFARNVLNVGPFWLGLLGASHGIGAFIGSAALAAAPRSKHGGALFGVGCTLLLVAILLFSFSTWFVVSMALLMGAGAAQAVFNTYQNALVLLEASEEVRGRVMGLLMLCISSGFIGLLVLGVLSAWYGAPAAVAINATAGLVILLLVVWRNPALRK